MEWKLRFEDDFFRAYVDHFHADRKDAGYWIVCHTLDKKGRTLPYPLARTLPYPLAMCPVCETPIAKSVLFQLKLIRGF